MISKQNSFAFDEGHPLPKPFNVEDNEGGGTLSINNNLLFFTKCSKISGNYNNCDIYFSEKIDGVWGDIQSLSDKICPKYSWESQPSLSSDGKTLFFASDRRWGVWRY